MSEENTSLIPLNQENAVDYFKPNGLDPIIEKIRKQVSALKPDTSTDKGRKEISSNARKVASAKVALDNIRKELVSGEKARLNAIDAEGSRAWDELELLQKEVRKPLDEWEAIDEKRIEAHKQALDQINSFQVLPSDLLTGIEQSLVIVESYRLYNFEEFSELAETSLARTTEILQKKRAEIIKRDEDRAELERLRQEAEERRKKDEEDRRAREEEQRKKEQAEREERIRKEAAEKAERDAKEKAERERLEAERKAKEESERLIREKEEADRRAQKAEEDRIAAEKRAAEEKKAAEEKAERERIEASAKAKREQEEAVERERQRIADEAAKKAQEEAVRVANQKHREKIQDEALFILKNLISEEDAKRVIEAIEGRHIPHVRIIY